MERKPKRRTRERILETSLRLFNDFGEPNVTTTTIADELNISRATSTTTSATRTRYEHDLRGVRARDRCDPGGSRSARADVEDIWLFLHVMFELVWRYGFSIAI